MAKIDVPMPQMGESIAEGTVSKWLKKVGDSVGRDEPLLEISTDKVDAEIPSPAAGVLTEIKVQEGTTVEVGSIVAVIDTEAAAGAAAPAAAPAAPAPEAPKAAPQAEAAPAASVSASAGSNEGSSAPPRESGAASWNAATKRPAFSASTRPSLCEIRVMASSYTRGYPASTPPASSGSSR